MENGSPLQAWRPPVPPLFFFSTGHTYIYMRRKKLMAFYPPKKCGVNVGDVWVS